MQWSIEVCVYHLSCMYIHIYFLCNYTHISHKEAPVCIKGLTSRSGRILYSTHLIVVFAITSYMHVFYFNRDFTASCRAKAITANIIHMTVHWVLRPYRLISQWSRRYHGRETSGIRVRKKDRFHRCTACQCKDKMGFISFSTMQSYDVRKWSSTLWANDRIRLLAHYITSLSSFHSDI